MWLNKAESEPAMQEGGRLQVHEIKQSGEGEEGEAEWVDPASDCGRCSSVRRGDF